MSNSKTDQKESRIYLNFFRQNILILLSLASLGGLIGFYYQSQLPLKTESQNDLEIEYDQNNLNQRITLTDEAVSLVRSQVLQNHLKLNPDNQIVVFKPGPLLIEIDVIGSDYQSVTSDQMSIDAYLKSYFPSHQITNSLVKSLPKSPILSTMLGLFLGGVIGLLIALVKFYFTNY